MGVLPPYTVILALGKTILLYKNKALIIYGSFYNQILGYCIVYNMLNQNIDFS